jgi:hypothetical protein
VGSRAGVILAGAAAMILLAACSGDEAEPLQTVFVGAFAGATEAGVVKMRLDLSGLSDGDSQYAITGPAPGGGLREAYGELMLPGQAPIPLSGTLEPLQNVVYLTGNGYVLAAYVEHGHYGGPTVVEGRFFGAHDFGLLALLQQQEDSPLVLCGRYGGEEEGNWNLVIASSGYSLGVLGATGQRRRYQLTGSRSGGRIALQPEYGEEQEAVAAEGTITAAPATAQGSWTRAQATGTWEASAASCSHSAGGS